MDKMDWNWDSTSHKGTQVKRAGVKKLKDEWEWQPVSMGPGGQYGSHQTGELFEDEVYPCGFCHGTGEKPKGSKCSVCKGNGTVPVEPPTVICAYCKGRGEEKPRGNVTCTACRGKGVIHVEEPIELCPHCRGTGKEPTNKLVCVTCRGKGVVTVKEEAAATADYAGQDKERREIFAVSATPAVTGSASGSERDALEVVKELGRADKIAVARNMVPPVSSAYAEQLCGALVKKRLLIRDGVFYSVTQHDEEALK